MVICSKCGKQNEDDAEYCNKCGNPLIVTKKSYKETKVKDSSFEKQVEDFAGGVERIGKKAGEKIEQTAKSFSKETQDLGKRIEKATDRASTRVENWYDRTFGIFGPFISSFICIIILRLIIEGLRIGAKDTPVLYEVADALQFYLLLIFIVVLLSSYSSYISRKYKPFRWVSPIIIAISIVVISMIVVNIISIVGRSTNVPDFAKVETEFREKYMLMIFVIVLLIGYLINVVNVAWEKDQKQ
jgi:ribosomal protein L40E